MAYVDSTAPQNKETSLTRKLSVRSRWEGRTESAVVFLHGNPTSSYLWRDVIPPVASRGLRCLAPDLIGMGKSEASVNGKYDFEEHSKHVWSWFDGVLPNNEKVHLVLHDWGSALGFHWAHRHPERVASITFMEGIVRVIRGWDEFPESGRKIFQAMRSDAGEAMVLKNNVFVEKILPASVLRKLEEDEHDKYREPFERNVHGSLPTLVWPRQIPIRGEGPNAVIDIVDAYNDWLRNDNNIPKLHIEADPGFFDPIMREETKAWSHVTTERVKGIHFIQEDSGSEIGHIIADFLDAHAAGEY